MTMLNFANLKTIELKGTGWTGQLNICVQYKVVCAWQIFITVAVKIVIIKVKYLYTHTHPAPLLPHVAHNLDHIQGDCQVRKTKSPV